ncbi:MAG: ABC transporter permease [Coriobacteriales bacterium]|nr:ABC transporter permease [Coriobacteriales bacterium]
MKTSALHAELVKLRRAPIWLAFVALPLVAAAIGTFNYVSNLAILRNGWFDLWTQHTLFSGMFFLHALVGASCSWLMRLEHRGTNWNQLMTAPASALRILMAKLLVAWLMLGVGLAVTGALFVGCGKLAGLSGLPGPEYAWWLVLGWVGGLASIACQLLVSLLVRNFAAPVGIAVIGGLVGFLLHAYDKGLAWPYGLVVVALNSNGNGALAVGQLAPFLASTVVFTMAALGIATLIMTKLDVKTGT